MADTASRPQTGTTIQSVEQVTIPQNLPDILKDYTKHIIKTRPKDILASSAEYFSRLARQKSSALIKIDTTHLRTFYSKFYNSEKASVSRREIDDAARAAGVAAGQVTEAVSLGAWTRDAIPWLHLWTLLVAATAGTFISTITVVCDIIGDNGRVMTPTIIEVLQYLSKMDQNVDENQVTTVVECMGASRIYPILDLLERIQKEVQPNDQPYNPKPPLARQQSKPSEEQIATAEATHSYDSDQSPGEEGQPQQQSRQQSRQASRHQSQIDVRKSRDTISSPQSEDQQPSQPADAETKREESITNITNPETTNSDTEPTGANAEPAPDQPEDAPPASREQSITQERQKDQYPAPTTQEKDASPQAGEETTEDGQYGFRQ